MSTTSQENAVYTLAEAKEVMATYIRQLPANVGTEHCSVPTATIRYELPIEPINILYWLHNQQVDTKIYWSGRDGKFEMGGIGVADCIKGEGSSKDRFETCPYINNIFSNMKKRLSADHPNLRYYGGFSFDTSCHDREWNKFGTYQFIIPQFEILHTNTQTTFAVNITTDKINNDSIKELLEQLNQIDFSAETAYRKPPHVIKRNDVPKKDEWDRIFADVSQDINNGNYEKAVLARRSIFDFDTAIRSCALIKHLKDITPNCFHFCFQPSADIAFLGATPERLFKRDDRRIFSEAIAGTRPRGVDQVNDKELETQLLNSKKDAHEHKYVVDMLREQFDLFCRDSKVDQNYSLRKLKGSQHLRTQFEGTLRSSVCDHEILKGLHPTPAVGGTPTETVMEVIRKKEPFGRGWYAGPVGYIGHNKSEFAVAIRSGLIHGKQLSLYAGAGIVAGSTSDSEWDEIENKISNFISVFNQ